MDWTETPEGRSILAIITVLVISAFGKFVDVLSLTQAVLFGLIIIISILVIYRYPKLAYRPLAALKVLIGKQPDTELAMMGIEEGVTSEEGSKYSPSSCMARADRDLDFMGMLGSKWVDKPENYNRFENLLKEIEQKGGQVRFLLADWKSEGYEKILERRNRENMSLIRRADHYRDYLELSKEYDCLSVRLYSQIPTFRMVFIDNSELGVSRYRYDPHTEDFDRGRKIPHLVVDKDTKFSFYHPFNWTFKTIWERSEEIKQEHIPTPKDEV